MHKRKMRANGARISALRSSSLQLEQTVDVFEGLSGEVTELQ